MNSPVRTFYLLKQAETIVRIRLDAALREHRLTSSQFTVLSLLDRPDPLSSAQVARRSFVTPQATNEMIASLEQKGLIQRCEDAETRRILRLSLTPAGARLVARCVEEIDRIEQDMLRDLTPHKIEMLKKTLSTIVATARKDASTSS